jgi:hypothetical protein
MAAPLDPNGFTRDVRIINTNGTFQPQNPTTPVTSKPDPDLDAQLQELALTKDNLSAKSQAALEAVSNDNDNVANPEPPLPNGNDNAAGLNAAPPNGNPAIQNGPPVNERIAPHNYAAVVRRENRARRQVAAPMAQPPMILQGPRQVYNKIQGDRELHAKINMVLLADKGQDYTPVHGWDGRRDDYVPPFYHISLKDRFYKTLSGGKVNGVNDVFLVPIQKHFQCRVMYSRSDKTDFSMFWLELSDPAHDLYDPVVWSRLKQCYGYMLEWEAQDPLPNIDDFFDTYRKRDPRINVINVDNIISGRPAKNSGLTNGCKHAKGRKFEKLLRRRRPEYVVCYI